MKLTLDAEHGELRDMVRRLVVDSADTRATRDTLAAGNEFDRSFWNRFAELGLLGVVVPEELGGAGFSAVERSIIMEELGRSVVPTPFFASSVLATDVMLAANDQPERTELLTALASGESIGAVAVAEGDAAWPTSGLKTTARRDGEEWVLDGVKESVVSGSVADVVLVLAQDAGGPSWFVVDPEQDGVQRQALTTLDTTRPIARLRLESARARRLEFDDPILAATTVRDQALVALAAEALGGHGRALEMTVEYAKVRMQFGRAIGSYQAVKHGLTNVLSSLELSQSVVRYAAWAASEAPEELPLAAALAHVYVPRAYFDAAAAAIHFHGGIGFTLEHDAHFYFKRAKSTELLFGGMGQRLEKLADRLAI